MFPLLFRHSLKNGIYQRFSEKDTVIWQNLPVNGTYIYLVSTLVNDVKVSFLLGIPRTKTLLSLMLPPQIFGPTAGP